MFTPGEEGRRQAYLAALEIPLWTARAPLPAAAPSLPLEWTAYVPEYVEEENDPEPRAQEEDAPDDATAVSSVSALETGSPPWSDGPPDDGPPLDAYLDDPEITAAAESGAQTGKGLSRQLRGQDSRSAVPTPATTAVPSHALPTEHLPPVRFQFALFTGARWRIVVPRLQLLSPSENRLLSNILRAIDASGTPLPFNWPMVNNPAMPQHRPAALQALGPFLARHGRDACGWIVLGDHETDLLALLADAQGLPVVPCAGLSLMLQQTGLKRDLWRALQA